MNKRKTFLLSLAFGLTTIFTVQGQTKFVVPQNVELNTSEDYKKYETAIIDAAKWLEETNLDKEAAKRKQVNTFVMSWISGSPTVSIDINEQLGTLCANNTQLLGLYLASYTRYFLENKSNATKFSATKAGLVSMINVYKKGIEMSKSTEMDKLIKLAEENKLDNYINDKLM